MSKLQNGVQKNTLLKSIREQNDPEYAGLVQVSKKQIEYLIEKFSIGQQYKLDEDESKSIEKFVIQDNGKTVKLYKPVGVYDTRYPKLEVNDFGLVIMNETQAEFLKPVMSGPTAFLCRLHSWNKRI